MRDFLMSALGQKRTFIGAKSTSASGQNRTHAPDAMPFLSAFALHRFVREPFELDRKWMPHRAFTLHHYRACGLFVSHA